MSRTKTWLGLLGVLALVVGCAEAATNPLAPPAAGNAVVLCNAELAPCDDGSIGSTPPPDPGYVEVNPCAECSGAPIIESTKVVLAIDDGGTVFGHSEMLAWGNAYTITMTVGGSISSGRSWNSPTVSDSYASGLLTLGGLSTRMAARSPQASVATGQTCGLTATGYATFAAEIKMLGGGRTWRVAGKSEQARDIVQKACATDAPREVDVPSEGAGGGGEPISRSDSIPCWDHYLVTNGVWYYQYTWCG